MLELEEEKLFMFFLYTRRWKRNTADEEAIRINNAYLFATSKVFSSRNNTENKEEKKFIICDNEKYVNNANLVY